MYPLITTFGARFKKEPRLGTGEPEGISSVHSTPDCRNREPGRLQVCLERGCKEPMMMGVQGQRED